MGYPYKDQDNGQSWESLVVNKSVAEADTRSSAESQPHPTPQLGPNLSLNPNMRTSADVSVGGYTPKAIGDYPDMTMPDEGPRLSLNREPSDG